MSQEPSVIIVGAGFAGLACAIECRLKGIHVLVLERFAELKVLGDIISFGANAGAVFERWGLSEKMIPICSQLDALLLHTSAGELIIEQKIEQVQFGARSYNGHRGELHKILYDHALSLGVEIRCSSHVTEILETDGEAAVVCNGERLTADVVIGADGVRSTARKLILGYDDKPKSSGYAIYRAWFDAEECGINDDPLTAMLTEGQRDHFYGWIGQDVHFLASSIKGGRDISFVLTHRDDADIEESWQFPGQMSDVLACVKGWDPRCAAILSKAPSVVDWKLVYREPLKTWVSPLGRCALIGDAAHPFLPTSIQGALEDGVTVACALKMAGKAKAPLAIRAFEAIRYQRVRRAQLTGESTRDKWHKTDSEAAKKNPDKVALPREEWLLGHDAEKHAFEVYPAVAAQIERHGYRLPELPDGEKVVESKVLCETPTVKGLEKPVVPPEATSVAVTV